MTGGVLLDPTPADIQRVAGEALAGRLDVRPAGIGPDAAAVEQTFVNKDAVGTLKLGQARGVALLAPAPTGAA